MWLSSSSRLQHAFPSLSPGVCSNSCPLSWWCYLTISSSAAPLLLSISIFPASESFPESLSFTGSKNNVAIPLVKVTNNIRGDTVKILLAKLYHWIGPWVNYQLHCTNVLLVLTFIFYFRQVAGSPFVWLRSHRLPSSAHCSICLLRMGVGGVPIIFT